MGGITDTEKAGAVPTPQTIDLDGQQLDLFPIQQLLHPITEERGNLADAVAEGRQPGLAHLLERPLGNNQPRLEVVAAIDQDQGLAEIHIAEDFAGIVLKAGQAEPEHVDGHAAFLQRQLCGLADGGVASVAGDD